VLRASEARNHLSLFKNICFKLLASLSPAKESALYLAWRVLVVIDDFALANL